MTRTSLSALFLIGVNTVPLVGVIFFGWSLFSIMLLYWFENGIIGLSNVFKIGLAKKPPSGRSNFTLNGRPVSSSNKFFLIPFFIFHYGIFWIVHGVFVVVLFGVFGGEAFTGFYSDTPGMVNLEGFRGFDPVGVAIAAAALALSHGASFFVNFVGNKEYLNIAPDKQMFRPYSRVVVLHVTILGGGFLAAYLGTPLASLVLMVVLKTAIDLWTHLKEHRKAVEDAGAPVAS